LKNSATYDEGIRLKASLAKSGEDFYFTLWRPIGAQACVSVREETINERSSFDAPHLGGTGGAAPCCARRSLLGGACRPICANPGVGIFDRLAYEVEAIGLLQP
jgi:hypothetical protein